MSDKPAYTQHDELSFQAKLADEFLRRRGRCKSLAVDTGEDGMDSL